MNIQDVPSPIDLRNPQDALNWANEANDKRPWRYDFFDYYVSFIQELEQQRDHIKNTLPIHVLEIGSGPGFLAKHLLSHCLNIHYSAVDFSQAMHELSKNKLLSGELERASYVIADFKTSQWRDDLAHYDVVIIHQALHELRHKHHATQFHIEVKSLLKPNASYLVCDHIFAIDAMQNDELYMSKYEHFQRLKQASYQHVNLVKEHQGLCLFLMKI